MYVPTLLSGAQSTTIGRELTTIAIQGTAHAILAKVSERRRLVSRGSRAGLVARIVSMDRLVGKDFEKGLAALKNAAES